MKKILLIIFLFSFFSPAMVAFAQTTITVNCNSLTSANCGTNGNLSYTPLEPILTNNGSYASLPSYLASVIPIILMAGFLLALVLFVIGAFQYMFSEATGTIDSAKKRMSTAALGALLLAGSYLILYTINPDLLTFKLAIRTQSVNSTSTTVNTTPRNNLSLEDARASLDRDLATITTASDQELAQRYNATACAAIRTDSNTLGSEYSRIRGSITAIQANQEPYKSQLTALLVESRQNVYDQDQCTKYGN